MSTEIMNVNANNEVSILNTLPTQDLDEFQRGMFEKPASIFGKASAKAGTSDTVLHMGNKLESKDVVGHVLTIVRVGFASLPATDMKGEPIFEPDSNGVAVQKMAVYPICHFKEAPGYYYNGGSMLRKNIEAWAAECGDDPGDTRLPMVNAAIDEVGGITVYFNWKDKRDGSGQRYVNMIVA